VQAARARAGVRRAATKIVAAEAVSGAAATEVRGSAAEAPHAAEPAATEAAHAAAAEPTEVTAAESTAATEVAATEVAAAEAAASAEVATAATSAAVARIGLVICRDREGERRREKRGETQFTHRHDLTLRGSVRLRVAALGVALPVPVYVVRKHGGDKANWINRSAAELDKSQRGRSATSHRT
jgi:hypothetical protein